jgi:hypothetical protein
MAQVLQCRYSSPIRGGDEWGLSLEADGCRPAQVDVPRLKRPGWIDSDAGRRQGVMCSRQAVGRPRFRTWRGASRAPWSNLRNQEWHDALF